MGIVSGTRVITMGKSNRSAKEDERSKIDSILPLKIEAPTGRKIFLWEITGDALAMIHASLDAVFRSKNKGMRSYTVTKAEVGTDVISRLSFKDVFIAGVGYWWIF